MERVLFENNDHKFILLGFSEPTIHEDGIPTNQYLIVNNGKGILLDPGGFSLYPILSRRLLNYLDSTEDLVGIFLSHQDPDVAASVGTWLKVFTNAKAYMSHVWRRFNP
ncbi:MAG TPA: MBL fold metallo-hydrolase, partial [Thermodesulfobium narugense]|nr:MBL fold metallo-hydrolase [Thermodesulfobium narugense]